MFIKKAVLFIAAVSCFAQGVVQQTASQLGNTDNWVIALNWTGDPSTGAVPVTQLRFGICPANCQGYFSAQAETVPGTPNPSGGYSLTIKDSAGIDVLGGSANALSSSTPQAFAASSSAPPLNGSLTLRITGQSVGGAKGTVYLFISKVSNTIIGSGGGGGGGGASCAAGAAGDILILDSMNNCVPSSATIDGSGDAAFPGSGSFGSSAPAPLTGGTAGGFTIKGGSTATPQASEFGIQANTSSNLVEVENNGAAFSPILTDARLPAATINDIQVGFTDNTTGNAGITKHGYFPKQPNNTGCFWNGVGACATPPGAGTVSVDGPFYPFGLPPVAGVALFTSDMASTVVIVDQFVSTVAKTINTVNVAFGSTLASGHAFLVGIYDHTCATQLGFGLVVGAGGGTTGAVHIALNTAVTLAQGITYSVAVASQDEVNPFGITGGVVKDAIANGMHYNATTSATFSGAGSTLPSTCPSAGVGYYATVQEMFQN